MLRFRVLTIPCETLRSRPSGIAHREDRSPALTSSPLPSTTWLGFRSFGSGSLSSARSKNGFSATISTSSIRRRVRPLGTFW